MKRTFLRTLLLLIMGLFLGLGKSTGAELNLDFTLVNKTGYEIKEVYIGPTSSDEWGDNVLEENLDDKATLELTFSPKATAKKWDIKCVYADGETAEWKGLKLTDISKITLFWSKSKGSTAKAE